MSLETLYLFSQIGAAIVIIATLFAILFQGWQSNKIARADLTLDSWVQTGQMQYAFVDSPEKVEFLHRALFRDAPLTDAEETRFAFICQSSVGLHYAAFNLRVRGLIEESAYQRIALITRWYFSSPRVRVWWRKARARGYSPDFAAYIDTFVAEAERPRETPANEDRTI
ncbi:MAG TPA: hypothetical protein DDZ68_10165 [Parvularcula sp.]|nr:hypothetical protein [Parvularcula sp.]HBS30952.1 hypothetical protein [Parvularcula sp.]HBS35316.1 hypothetical protein [Parvularcula sp.]